MGVTLRNIFQSHALSKVGNHPIGTGMKVAFTIDLYAQKENRSFSMKMKDGLKFIYGGAL